MNGTLTIAKLAALTLSMVAGAGCDLAVLCDDPQDVPRARCDVGGGAHITSSTLALPDTIAPVQGNACLADDGRCGDDPSIHFQSSERKDHHSLDFGFKVARTDGPGTYAVTGDGAVNTWATLADDTNVARMVPTAGQVVVTRNDAEAFQATFKVDLVSEDGAHRVSLTGGTADVDDCEIVQVPTCREGNGFALVAGP